MQVRSTQYITPSEALSNLNPRNLINKLLKLHMVPEDSLSTQESLRNYLEEAQTQTNTFKLPKQMDKLKLTEGEKAKVSTFNFTTQSQLILIIPELSRLTEAQREQIVKSKNGR